MLSRLFLLVKRQKLFFFSLVVSLLFLLCLSLNISSFLRGPAPYPPDWRWPYVFINTLSRIWAPIVIGVSILFVGWKSLKKKVSLGQIRFVLFLLVVLMFLFELSLLYYSRAGIFVLLHRIINPDLNGYFTVGIGVTNLKQFLFGYNNIVLHLPMHATGHPPGAILFFSLLRLLARFLPTPISLLKHSPSHIDVATTWTRLRLIDRYTAVIAAFLIPLLSTLVIFPVYGLARYLYGQKTALIAVLLYIFTPSVSLFIPINDTFLGLFSITSVLLFMQGLGKKNWLILFFSGIIFSFGLFLSTSLLPIAVVFCTVALLQFLRDKKNLNTYIVLSGAFIIGIILFPFLLFLYSGFNFFQVIFTLMTGLPKGRAYLTWLLYNPYAFFLFAGLPALPYFVLGIKKQLVFLTRKRMNKLDSFIVSFAFMMVLLFVSGAVRGEVERIWLPFMPLLTIIVARVLAETYKEKKVFYMSIVFLQVIQIFIFQTFLVTLW